MSHPFRADCSLRAQNGKRRNKNAAGGAGGVFAKMVRRQNLIVTWNR
jgi:hypothetical protein